MKKNFVGRIVFFVMIMFIIFVGVCVYSQSITLYKLEKEESFIAQQIENEQEKKLNLEGKQRYYESDEYIEKVAREQLGLVKSGELVFVNSAN